MDERRKYLEGKLQGNVDVDSAAHSRRAPGRPRASTQAEGGAAASGGGGGMGAPMPAMPPPPAMMIQPGQTGVTNWQEAKQPPISGSGTVAGAEPSGIPPYLMMQKIGMLNQQLHEQQQIIMRLEKEKRDIFRDTNVSDEVARLYDQKEMLRCEIFGMNQVRQNLFLSIQQMQMDMQRMGMMQLKYESF